MSDGGKILSRLAFPGRPFASGGRAGKPILLMSRREFVRNGARNAVAASLALVGIALGRRAISSDAACTNKGVCGACSRFESCGLPRALSVRRAHQETYDA